MVESECDVIDVLMALGVNVWKDLFWSYFWLMQLFIELCFKIMLQIV